MRLFINKILGIIRFGARDFIIKLLNVLK